MYSTKHVLLLDKKFDRPDPDGELKEVTQAIYNELEGLYVYRHIRDELTNRGHKVNHTYHKRIKTKRKGMSPVQYPGPCPKSYLMK